tara:strand:+ start:5379 stop:5501 length:123 start_codon:yes stop_codon:yes gene_type:complete
VGWVGTKMMREFAGEGSELPKKMNFGIPYTFGAKGGKQVA